MFFVRGGGEERWESCDGADITQHSTQNNRNKKKGNSPFLRTLKFLALILFLSCLFSLLLIFLYSSGLGLQSSLSLSSTVAPPLPTSFSFPDDVEEGGEGASFLIPPEATVPLRAFPFPPTLMGAMMSETVSTASSSSSISNSSTGLPIPTSEGSIPICGDSPAVDENASCGLGWEGEVAAEAEEVAEEEPPVMELKAPKKSYGAPEDGGGMMGLEKSSSRYIFKNSLGSPMPVACGS